MNKGGTLAVAGCKVTMTQAVHSSAVDEGGELIAAGDPGGFVVEFPNGFVAYHAGDTAAFRDMELIRELYHPELAMLPIGSHYVMSPAEAALACRMLKPRWVIPMHYGTFPVLTGTPGGVDRAPERGAGDHGHCLETGRDGGVGSCQLSASAFSYKINRK